MQASCQLIAVAVVSFVSITALLAQEGNGEPIPPGTGGTFSITRHTIDAGYQEISGGVFTMRGTVGQAEAGISQGNDTVLIGGF